MAFRSCVAVTAIVLIMAGCSIAPPASSVPVAAPGTSAAVGAARLLLDGATVAMTFESGPGSTRRGRRGLGLFTSTYDAAAGTFGPAAVTSHTRDAFSFRTDMTTCTLRDAGLVTCRDGTRGRWNAV